MKGSLYRVNVACGQAEERILLTGLHAVADIYCECCKTPLGWKYVSATYLVISIRTLKRFIPTGTRFRIESKI